MTTTQNIQKNKFNQDAYQSRWGWHSCDHETYLKLKKLKKLYFKALHRNAEWERWVRKQPQNQVLRKWFRNDKGQKTHFEIVGPMVEPKIYPVFGGKRYVPKGEHALNDMGVLDAYNNARTPRATPDEVKPIGLTIEQINNMLAHLEKVDNI